MVVGVMSDSHGDAAATAAAVALLERLGAETLFHCGDVCGDDVLAELAGRTVHFVWGNCDRVRPEMRALVERLGLPWPQGPVSVTLGGRRIGVFHGHERAFRDALADGAFDYVFYGHTHVADDRRIGGVRAINPGALYRAGVKTVATVDLARDEAAWWTLDGRRHR